MPHARRLRELLAGPGAFVAPGVFDALGALLVEKSGFSCAYLSGSSISMTRLGRPDLGLTTLTEVAEVVGNIRDRVVIPLVVDADNGFGNALNVQRTVRLFERMGASGIQLEDQTMPKRCGHLAGKQLITAGEMVGKIHAAQDARANPETVIVARTDALAIDGVDAALERAADYADAGADVLFVESPGNEAELKRIAESLGGRVPLLANMVEGGKTPLLNAGKLGDFGFRMVIFPGAMVRVLTHAVHDYLQELRRHGTTAGMLDRMLSFDQVNELIGLDELLGAGEVYAPPPVDRRGRD